MRTSGNSHQRPAMVALQTVGQRSRPDLHTKLGTFIYKMCRFRDSFSILMVQQGTGRATTTKQKYAR